MSRSSHEKQIHGSLFLACQKLRGRIDASSFKNYLLAIIFLKQASLLSLRDSVSHEFPELNTRVLVPPTATFDTLFEKRHHQGNGRRIDAALRELEAANGREFYRLFGAIEFSSSKFGGDKQSDEILRELLESLGPSADFVSPEVVERQVENTAWMYDSAVEYFAEFEGKLGENFSTPKAVGELLSRVLKPHPNETIYDPASGTGSLLIAMANEARKNFGGRSVQIFGQEINESTCSVARMNLFIHGEYRHTIAHGDTLLSPAFVEDRAVKQFDIAVSHPPFQMRWDGKKAELGPFNSRYRYGIPPDGKADYAFILHMLASLRPHTGRMGVVVSYGVLFRGGIEGKIRESIIRENLLDAVIGLPPKLFYHTGIPVAVLVFRKDRPERQRSVLFIDASQEFDAGRIQNRLEQMHVAKIAETYQAFEERPHFSRRVDFDEIEKNSFNLSIQRYISQTEDSEVAIDLHAIRAERQHVMADIHHLEAEMSQFIADLGINRRSFPAKRGAA